MNSRKSNTFSALALLIIPISCFAMNGGQTPIDAPAQPLISPKYLGSAKFVNLYSDVEEVGPDVPGFKFGDVIVAPRFSEEISYDSNVLGAFAGNERGDFILNQKPSMTMKCTPFSDFSLDASYEFGYNDYINSVGRNYLTHDASMTANWNNIGVEGFSFNLTTGYEQTGNNGVLEHDFVAFRRLEGYRFLPECYWKKGDVTIAAEYGYSATNYFQKSDSGKDFTISQIDGLCSYQITDRGLSVFGSYLFQNVVRPDARQNFKSDEIRVGAQGQLQKMSFKMGIGENLIKASSGGQDLTSKPGGFLEFAYSPTHILTFRTEVNRALVAGPLTGTSTNLEYNAALLLKLIKRQQTNIFFRNLDERYPTYDRRTLQYGVNMEFNIRRHANVVIRLERSQQSSTIEGNINIFRATVGGSIGF